MMGRVLDRGGATVHSQVRDVETHLEQAPQAHLWHEPAIDIVVHDTQCVCSASVSAVEVRLLHAWFSPRDPIISFKIRNLVGDTSLSVVQDVYFGTAYHYSLWYHPK